MQPYALLAGRKWQGRTAIAGLAQALLAALIAFAALLAGGQESLQIQDEVVVGEALVTVGPDGVANVTLYVNSTIGPTAALIDLPVEPLGGRLKIVSGDAHAAIYLGEWFALILFNSSQAHAVIEYSSSPSASEGFLLYTIRSPSWALRLTVKIHRGFEVHALPDTLIDSGAVGEYYYYVVAPGYLWDLALSPRSGGLQGLSRGQAGPFGVDLANLRDIVIYAGIPAAGALAALTISVIVLRRLRRRGRDLLDSVDNEILEILRRSGGSAFASDIASATGLPKTTLWRRLRKLEKLGHVEISRAGRQSLVRLKRPRRS